MLSRLAPAVVLGLAAAAAPLAPTDALAASMPTASTPATRLGAVAAIFASPTARSHGCSGVVVETGASAVVLTAAHCVPGRGTGLRVVPGYDRGARPFGTWRVTGVYVDPGWQRGADPRRDLAVLRVAPQTVGGAVRTLRSVAGGYHLGAAPAAGTTIRGYGYRAGSGDRVVGCASTASLTWGYPTFPCRGMSGGVSGGPFITLDARGAGTVRGVIGGLHEGGCSPDVSYSAPFGAWSTALVRRAARGGTPDYVGRARGSGC